MWLLLNKSKLELSINNKYLDRNLISKYSDYLILY